MPGRRLLYLPLVTGMLALTGYATVAHTQRSDIETEYRAAADRIIAAALRDSSAYERLRQLVDGFGPRFSGTPNLEAAIDWTLAQMRADGLENVRGEDVMVPHWVRGAESAELVEPWVRALPMLGLGRSVATPAAGITAPVLVVGSFDELTARADEARGRIVVFNVPFTTYRETVKYRADGASAAARVGAVASLLRSVTPFSLQTPHTGTVKYDSTVALIPAAAITVEDAMLLQRMQDAGQRPVVRLMMSAKTLPDVRSRNVVAELRGSTLPHEVVVLGGHIDSWDVGQGAMDDGGGCIAAWEAVRIIKALGLRPRRTLRVVLWTNEENGLKGANAYAERHAAEIEHHVLAIESDAGVFKPLGFTVGANDSSLSVLRQVARLLEPIEAGSIQRGSGAPDIGPLMKLGVQGMGLLVEPERYFWYHHTGADMLDKIDARELALSVATMAVMAYVVADLPERLPAGGAVVEEGT